MTAPRQKRKAHRGAARIAAAIAAAGAGAALLGLFWIVPGAPTGAATTERIVVDHHTGLAIGGFDPVAYFVESAAVLGRPDHEIRHAGAVWRFVSEGNRAAFAADPAVYRPQFGGYDPVAVARGAPAPGHPEIWLIEQDRLFLFHNRDARESFRRDPARSRAQAELNWPRVLLTLSP